MPFDQLPVLAFSDACSVITYLGSILFEVDGHCKMMLGVRRHITCASVRNDWSAFDGTNVAQS